ncbi:aminotransferase [Enterobacter hormaechei]|nr:aminotransferase [Enterobacter hormaechei]
MDNFYTYRSKKDLLLLAQEVAALMSCAAYLSTIKGEAERIHLMSLTHLAQRLSDELANSLDISTFSDHETQEARP